MIIIGYYNETGYQVKTDNPIDRTIYRAGNHELDSQQDASETEYQLSLETIRTLCEQTTRDIAEEKNAEFGGVEYLGEYEI